MLPKLPKMVTLVECGVQPTTFKSLQPNQKKPSTMPDRNSLSLSLSSTLIFKIRLSIRPARNQVSCVQCYQIWRNFATFAKIKKFWSIFWRLFSIGENFEPVLPNFVCCWAHFNCYKRPNIEKQFCHLVTLQLRECTCMPHHTDDHI